MLLESDDEFDNDYMVNELEDDELASTAVTAPQISLPSRLSVDTIAHLTRDELRHNLEFLKYVKMVDSLQELLRLRSSVPTGESSLFFVFFLFFFLFFFSFSFFLKQSPRLPQLFPNRLQALASYCVPFPFPSWSIVLLSFR